jgi:hypothetical protein
MKGLAKHPIVLGYKPCEIVKKRSLDLVKKDTLKI